MVTRRSLLITILLLLVSSTAYSKRRRRSGGSNNEEDIPLRFRGHGIFRGDHYEGKVLSRQELKECVLREEKIDDTEAEANELKAKLSNMSDVLKESSRKIESKRLHVDQHSQESVDSFNEGLAGYQQMVENYNDLFPNYNKIARQIKSNVEEFNSKCGERAYYIDEMINVLNELGVKS